jgi:hypothetical protein
MTRAGLLARVQQDTGADTVITSVDTLGSAILRDITTRRPALTHYKALSLVAGTWEYALTSALDGLEVGHVLTVFDHEGAELDAIDTMREFFCVRGDGSGTGDPTGYHVGRVYYATGKTNLLKMMLSPTPNTTRAYNVLFSYIHQDISGSQDILLSTEWDDAIVCGYLWLYYRGHGDHENGERYRNYYESKIAQVAAAVSSEPLRAPYRDI